MTLQVWSILVNAVIAALILVGGIWLRSVVTQQLKSKDTAIQALDATIKSKEAEQVYWESEVSNLSITSDRRAVRRILKVQAHVANG